MPQSDPLGRLYARQQISQAQYLAGVELAKSIAADDQTTLARAHAALGEDGMAIVRDLLIRHMSARQIGEARKLMGQEWQRYHSKRVHEILGTLARVLGFSTATRSGITTRRAAI